MTCFRDSDSLELAWITCRAAAEIDEYTRGNTSSFKQLGKFENLKVIGRTGSFSYLNMWECLKWVVC